MGTTPPPPRKRKSPEKTPEKPKGTGSPSKPKTPLNRTSKRSTKGANLGTPPSSSPPPSLLFSFLSTPKSEKARNLSLAEPPAKRRRAKSSSASVSPSPSPSSPSPSPSPSSSSSSSSSPSSFSSSSSSSSSSSPSSPSPSSSSHQRVIGRDLKSADEKEDAKAKERAFLWEQDVARRCEKKFKSDVIPHNNTGATFSNFPYTPNKVLNHALIHAAFPILSSSTHYPQIESLKALNRHVLLSGGEGSQLYHEALVRSLAAEMDANLYIFDHRLFSSAAVVPKCGNCHSSFCLFGDYEPLPTLASFTPPQPPPLVSSTRPSLVPTPTPTRSPPLPPALPPSVPPPALLAPSHPSASPPSTPTVFPSIFPSPSPSPPSPSVATPPPSLPSLASDPSPCLFLDSPSEPGAPLPPFSLPFSPSRFPASPAPSSSPSTTPSRPPSPSPSLSPSFSPPALLPSPPRPSPMPISCPSPSSSLFPSSQDPLPAIPFLDKHERGVGVGKSVEVGCAVERPRVDDLGAVGAADGVVGMRDSVGDVDGDVGMGTDVSGEGVRNTEVGLAGEDGIGVHLEDKGKGEGQKKGVEAFSLEPKGVNRTFKIGDYVIYTGRTQLVPTSSPLQAPTSSPLRPSSSSSSSPSSAPSSAPPAVSSFSLFSPNSTPSAPSLSSSPTPAPSPTPVPASFLQKTPAPRQNCNTLIRGLKGKIINISGQNAQVRFEQPTPAVAEAPRQRLVRATTNATANNTSSSTKYEIVQVQVSDLKLDPRPHLDRDAVGNIALEVLLSIISGSKKPAIVYFPDSEKSILSGLGRFSAVKKMLDSFANSPVMVIASLFTKPKVKEDKAKQPATFFLSSLQNFGAFDSLRKEDRAKPKPEPTRVLSRVFNLELKVEDPKGRDLANLEDGADVTGWKKFLSKGKQARMLEINSLTLKRELKRLGLEVKRSSSEGGKLLEGFGGVCFSHPLLMARELEATDVNQASGFALSRAAMLREQAAEQNGAEASGSASAALVSETIKGNSDPSPLKVSDLRYGLNLCSSLSSSHRENFGDIEMNGFEKKIATEVIDPADIGVQFDDIGSLGPVKKVLNDMVILPLKRPELFCDGILSKQGKGILLFGPPGTGKTMLAKAVATASGAYFLNVSMSLIGSKWFGEGEKYARAVFTLATKLSPCVIFIDEVDSLLGKRSSGEHEAMRKIKTEFMMMWDGLTTNEQSHIVILAATNRPFDLDDAILRRLPRRLLVDLPNEANRAKILELLLKKEKLEEGFSMSELAKRTEGFTGSDLKSLSLAAAFRRIHDFLEEEKRGAEVEKGKAEKEKEKEKEKGKKGVVKAKELFPPQKVDLLSEDFAILEGKSRRKAPELRPLKLNDFVESLKEVKASVSEDSFSVAELRRWNQMFGTGAGGKHSSLSYFI